MGFATNDSSTKCGYVSSEARCSPESCPFLFLPRRVQRHARRFGRARRGDLTASQRSEHSTSIDAGGFAGSKVGVEHFTRLVRRDFHGVRTVTRAG